MLQTLVVAEVASHAYFGLVLVVLVSYESQLAPAATHTGVVEL